MDQCVCTQQDDQSRHADVGQNLENWRERSSSANPRFIQQSPSQTKPPASLGKALLWAALLIFLDAFLFNQGGIAGLVGLGLVFIGLPRTFLAKFAAVRSQRFRNLGIYACAVMLVFVFNGLNNRLARDRANMLVTAIKAFQAKNQHYPESLSALVPEFIEAVPLAKYTLGQNTFYYHHYMPEDKASLFYVALPPFGRPMYFFPENRWSYMD